MAENQKKTIEFKELPDQVKTWLSSAQITFLVSELNRRLGFKEEEKMRVIPTLILRIAIADISPESFVSELSKLLGANTETAKSIAKEIEEKMLRPIEIILRNQLGIDIKLIHVSPIPSPVQPIPSEAHPIPMPLPTTSRPIPVPPPLSPKPTLPTPPLPPTPPSPIKIPLNVQPSKIPNKLDGGAPKI